VFIIGFIIARFSAALCDYFAKIYNKSKLIFFNCFRICPSCWFIEWILQIIRDSSPLIKLFNFTRQPLLGTKQYYSYVINGCLIIQLLAPYMIEENRCTCHFKSSYINQTHVLKKNALGCMNTCQQSLACFPSQSDTSSKQFPFTDSLHMEVNISKAKHLLFSISFWNNLELDFLSNSSSCTRII